MSNTSGINVMVLLPLVVVCASCATDVATSQATPLPGANTTGLRDAVGIASSAVAEQSHYPADDYVLVSAQQILLKGKYVWRVTFKPARLLPKHPSKREIGAGGEIFVNVDLDTRKPELGYGE